MNHEAEPIVDRVISQLEYIVRTAHQQVYASYRSVNSSDAAEFERTTDFAPNVMDSSSQLNTQANLQQNPFTPIPQPEYATGVVLQSSRESSSFEQGLHPSMGSAPSQPPSFDTNWLDGGGQHRTSEISPFGERTVDKRQILEFNDNQDLLNNDLDWNVVAAPENCRDDSASNPNDFKWDGSGDDTLDEFFFDNYIRLGGCALKAADNVSSESRDGQIATPS